VVFCGSCLNEKFEVVVKGGRFLLICPKCLSAYYMDLEVREMKPKEYDKLFQEKIKEKRKKDLEFERRVNYIG